MGRFKVSIFPPTSYLHAFRFEPDIPAGATITYVGLSLTSNQAGTGSSRPYGRFALLPPDGIWETGNGFSAYSPAYRFPNINTDSACYLGRPTGVGLTWQPNLVTGAGQECGYWSGAGAALWAEVPGLVADVQSFLSDYEALRGTGAGPGIPIAFVASAQSVINFLQTARSMASDPADWPVLTIEYTVPALFLPSSISARTSSGLVAAARTKTSLAATASVGSAAAVRARANSGVAVSSRVSTGPVISGRGRTA